MEWTQTIGELKLRSTDGCWIIQPCGREYLLTTAEGYAAWRPRRTIAACKQQAKERSTHNTDGIVSNTQAREE